jgi:hypothetical protein
MNKESVKFWLAIAVFVLQGLGSVFVLGAQTESVKNEVTVLKRDITKLETNQALLLQLLKDVAVLQTKDVELEKRLDRVERK